MCYQATWRSTPDSDPIKVTAHTHLAGINGGAPLPEDQLMVYGIITAFVQKDDQRLELGKFFKEGESTPVGVPHQHPPYEASYTGDGCHIELTVRGQKK